MRTLAHSCAKGCTAVVDGAASVLAVRTAGIRAVDIAGVARGPYMKSTCETDRLVGGTGAPTTSCIPQHIVSRTMMLTSIFVVLFNSISAAVGFVLERSLECGDSIKLICINAVQIILLITSVLSLVGSAVTAAIGLYVMGLSHMRGTSHTLLHILTMMALSDTFWSIKHIISAALFLSGHYEVVNNVSVLVAEARRGVSEA